MEIEVLGSYLDNGLYTVTFNYWKTGVCACTKKKVKRQFHYQPTKAELIESI